ncbi:tryptophan 2,3-dioxygenase family protein [Aliiglaciecola sp.]|nr:tryptophan 2,3-dioxygenase family protein [Aliiglaciecola sp.]
MYRAKYSEMLENPEILDYGAYLQCDTLLQCQKPLESLCNSDELQFQIVHQVEELWMKLMIYSLIDVLEYMQKQESHRVITLMGRVHRLQRMMIEQMDLLETMSPKEYQEIRLQLGNGSGQESPGFRTLVKIPKDLWQEFEQHYVVGRGKSIESIYDSEYAHDDSYVIAEALLEFDELLQKFRWQHMFLIQRSIGIDSRSLKGRPVEMLRSGARHQFFPELWDIRNQMTDAWGQSYGKVRDSLLNQSEGTNQ